MPLKIEFSRSKCPDSKHPESKHPVVQSPSVQSSRVLTIRPGSSFFSMPIFRQNQAYSEIVPTYSGIFRILCNPDMSRTLLRTRAYSEPSHIIRTRKLLRNQTYWQPCQTSMMEHFGKINKKHGGQDCQGPGAMNFDISFTIKTFVQTNVKTRHLHLYVFSVM